MTLLHAEGSAQGWRRLGGAGVVAPVLAVLPGLPADGALLAGGPGGVARRSSEGTWAPRGADVGPVVALARAGRTVLAGGVEGIAWSGDDARSWARAEIQGVVSPVSALAGAGREVLAGTIGGGVLRSADEGRHWVPAGFGLASRDVNALAWATGETVVAGTEAGVHVSPNAGRAWRQVPQTGQVRVAALAVPSSGGWWAVGEGGELLESGDQGRSWAQVSSLPAGAVPSALVAGRDALLVATSAGILRSGDGGRHWELAHEGAAFAVSSVGAVALAGAADGLLRSDDDGTTWTTAGTPPVHDLARLVVTGPADDPDVLAYGPMTGVVRGVTGEPVDGAPRPVAVVTAFSTANGRDGLLASGPDGLVRSADAGESWTAVVEGEAGFVHVITSADDGEGWAASADGARLLHTVDHGHTWTSVEPHWGIGRVLALALRHGTLLAATHDPSRGTAELWRISSQRGWAHAGSAPAPRPAVGLCTQPPAAAFGGRWLYGEPDGRWRHGAGPAGLVRQLVGRDDRLIALTDVALEESADAGHTWRPIDGPTPSDVLDVALTADAAFALVRSGELWMHG